MQKAEAEGTTATASEDKGKNHGPKPRNLQEQKATAQESKEAALDRAFGEVPDDDDLLSDFGAAEAEPEEEAAETEAEAEASPQVSSKDIDPRAVASLQERLEELEEKLSDERERQDTEDEDIDFDVEVPENWEAIKPSLTAIGKRSELQFRDLSKKIEGMVQRQYELQARVDLAQFMSRHKDFETYADKIADTAKSEGIDLYDYKSLQVVYDLVKGREAMAQLAAVEKRQVVAQEMGRKAGAVPRFRSTQQQTRDESVAPGNKLLSFDQAWEKGLARLRKNVKR